MSIAFHPAVRKNGRFFVYYTVRPLASVIDGYQARAATPIRPTGLAVEILVSLSLAVATAAACSSADGYLYIGLGDGGEPAIRMAMARILPPFSAPCSGSTWIARTRA